MMSNALSALTKAGIKSAYKSATFHKGKNYYAAQQVVDLHMSHPSITESLINAQVQGTILYTVSMRIQNTKHTIHLHGECSCPLKQNCKHIVATLLQAVDHQALFVAETTSNVTPFDSKGKPDIIDDPRVNRWLSQLQDAMTETSAAPVPIDEGHGLYYVLSKIAGESHQLGVEPLLTRHLKTGGLGASKQYSETAYAQQKHLYPIDKELLAQLDVIKRSTRYHGYSPMYCLRGIPGEALLLELINTGRCHWRSVHSKPLSLAEPQSVELNWEMDDQGMQTLRFGVPDQHYPIFFIEQPWYLDEAQSVCGLLNTPYDLNIEKLLVSAPKIPPAQVDTVVNFLSQHAPVADVKPPKQLTKRRLQNIKPVPHLRLFQAPIRSMYVNQYYPEAETMKALAEVSFVYDGLDVPWHNSNETVHQVQNEQLITLVRQKPFEVRALQALMQFNALVLSSIPELSRLTANEKWKNAFLIEHASSDPLVFSTTIVPKLRQAGWHIEFDADYLYQIMDEPIDEWYSSIREESSEYDWFGLELGITVKGENINLLPVLQTMLKQLKPQALSQTDDSEPIYARLPNGHYIPLPAARVKNLLNVLIELYDTDSLSDEQELRLSRLHASRLLELDAAMGAAQLRWIGGDRIREMGRKLAHFSGIQQAEVPKQFLAELRPYQLEGLSWLQFLREYELGGVLADDMGLGKTVQALAHITLEKTSGRMREPCLVIAPTSLMFNWQMETKRFSPELKVLLLHGADRKEQFDSIADYDLILTTYPLIVRDKHILLEQHFHLLILDEAQFIKNAKSQAALVAIQLKATHRLCLTGTPMENHMGELWSLFHFMMPGLLGDQKSFQRLFRTPIEKHENQERRQHLNRRIAPFLLRRTKDKVVQELPEKVEMIRHVELEGGQRDLYETVRITMQEKIQKEIAKLGLKRSHIIILDALLKLRQICCDPRLLKIKTTKQKASKSAKLELLMTLLPELIEEGRRILLFSQFTEMLGLIEEAITKAGIPYVKLTGQTKDRATPVQQFQSGEVPLFLISLKAGGTGLNLTAADVVIHYDPWWNPAVENQATDRAHRIGQEKTVFVYKLVVKGTVEEKILEMQQRKKELMDGLFSDKTTSKLELTEQDLKGLFDEF